MPITRFLVAVLIMLIAGFYLPNIWQSLLINTNNTVQPQTNSSRQYCQLSSQPCRQNGAEIQLQHDILVPLQASTMLVTWPQVNTEQLLLTLHGLEMDLGTVKYPLIRQPDGRYLGTIILPICTENTMTWVGNLQADDTNRIYTAIKMAR